METLKFGVLGTAQIGINSVIPGLQKSNYCQVKAIASRTLEKAKQAAEQLNIKKSYGLYDDLLSDDEIDAVYIPLPNHLHVPWSIKALQAGKHVLCEKPLALNTREVEELQRAVESSNGLKCMEAFMYRFHPQWRHVKEIINSGKIGKIRSLYSTFTYYNIDPENIRNKYAEGGGGLMDIGCYCISTSRFLLNMEPDKVVGELKYDSDFNIDNNGNCLMDFADKTASFIYGTQQYRQQEVVVHGTQGKIIIDQPFTPPADEKINIYLIKDGNTKTIEINPADQYRLQADEFARSIIDNNPLAYSLQDSYNNMKVIDALFESSKKGEWVML